MQWKAMVGATAALVALAGPARADAVADFYRGKSVSVLVGFTAGGRSLVFSRPSFLAPTEQRALDDVPPCWPNCDSEALREFLAAARDTPG